MRYYSAEDIDFATYTIKATFQVEDKLFVVTQRIQSNMAGRDILECFSLDDKVQTDGNVIIRDDEVEFIMSDNDRFICDYDDVENYLIALEIVDFEE